jgi:hypothetical protein
MSLADAWGRGPAASAAAAATDSGAAGLFPPGPQVGEEGRSLLTSLLSPVPGDRPSPREALAHPWFDPIRAAFTRLFGVDVLEDVARARDAEAAREAEAAAARRRAEEGEAAEAAERERAEQLRRRLREEEEGEEGERAEAAGAEVVAAGVGSETAGDDEKVPVSSLPVAVPVPAEPALLDSGPAPAPLVPDPVTAAAAAVDDGPSPPLAPDAEVDAPAVESTSSPYSRSAPLSHAATVVGDGEPDSLRFRDFFVFALEDKIGEWLGRGERWEGESEDGLPLTSHRSFSPSPSLHSQARAPLARCTRAASGPRWPLTRRGTPLASSPPTSASRSTRRPSSATRPTTSRR